MPLGIVPCLREIFGGVWWVSWCTVIDLFSINSDDVLIGLLEDAKQRVLQRKMRYLVFCGVALLVDKTLGLN